MSDAQQEIRVFVAGVPAPQGSKSFKGTFRDKKTGALRGIMVESSKKVAPWRADVRAALIDKDGQPIGRFPDGPVRVSAVFVVTRPKSTPKRRQTPPAVKKPDGDKLLRSTLDAIKSAGVYTDDSQVTAWPGVKRLAEIDEPTGCYLIIDRPPELGAVKWLH